MGWGLNKVYQGLIVLLFIFSAASLFRSTIMLIEHHRNIRDWYVEIALEMSAFVILLGVLVHKSSSKNF